MIVMTAKTHGFVYVLRRDDLRTCYVGQSVHTGRPYKHLREGCYQQEALCADGVQPTIEVVQKQVLRGPLLDEAERSWMRRMSEDGWTLINHLGPDDQWPRIPFELLSKGGKRGGVVGGTATAAHRAADPEFDAYWREVAAKAGMRALRARRAEDPEFDARCREAALRGIMKGVGVRRQKRATDQVWAAQERENARKGGLTGGRSGGRKTSAIKRRCNDCDIKPTTPMGMWHHLKASGHSGYTQLESEQVASTTQNPSETHGK